jgi:ferredoxin-NADP reductase
MDTPAITETGEAPSGGWCTGVVREVRHPNPDAVLLRLEVDGRTQHLPGQHYVFRLTAEDGYTASRSYSVASSPADPLLEFYVERLDDGEVSTHLADVVEPGDELELRGPIGGWFVWDGSAPAVGVAGGTGLVPLVAMLRHARDLGRPDLISVVVSARTRAELPYPDELGDQTVLLTREALDGRAAGRLAAADLAPVLDRTPGAAVYVCGSAGFAAAAGDLLMDLGVPAGLVRVERFGPTG